jgi:hypothetical protein
MTAEFDQARDDLAFMRSLVSGGEKFQAAAGELFLWAGLLYGFQCVGQWLAYVGAFNLPPIGHLILGFGPTAVFLVVVAKVIWRERKAPKGGPTTRALNAVFQGAGIANLVMALVFAYGAHRAQDFTVWLYHPVVVCMFQGVAWYVAWVIRKRAWLGAVSLGWFAVTVALGLAIGNTGAFLLIIAAALFALMAAPGYAMMRLAKRAEA